MMYSTQSVFFGKKKTQFKHRFKEKTVLDKVDEALVESFPASDAPAWAMGQESPPAQEVEADMEENAELSRLWRKLRHREMTEA